jgi:hypothetical protein
MKYQEEISLENERKRRVRTTLVKLQFSEMNRNLLKGFKNGRKNEIMNREP